MHFYLLRPWQPTNQDWCRQPGEFNGSGLRAACKQALGWNILSSMGVSDRWGGKSTILLSIIMNLTDTSELLQKLKKKKQKTIHLLQWKNDYKGKKKWINTSGFHFQWEEKRIGDRFESLERARDVELETFTQLSPLRGWKQENESNKSETSLQHKSDCSPHPPPKKCRMSLNDSSNLILWILIYLPAVTSVKTIHLTQTRDKTSVNS